MSRHTIPFDSTKHHIYVEFEVVDGGGIPRYALGILDTGAPRTEFSDAFPAHVGLLDKALPVVSAPPGQETMKYRMIQLACVTICGCRFRDSAFMVSRFDSSWGIDALIGLDLFRRSTVTIDYRQSRIISEPH